MLMLYLSINLNLYMPYVSLRFSYGLFCLQCTNSSALHHINPSSTSTGEEFPSIKSLRGLYCKFNKRAQPLLMTDNMLGYIQEGCCHSEVELAVDLAESGQILSIYKRRGQKFKRLILENPEKQPKSVNLVEIVGDPIDVSHVCMAFCM